MMSYTKALGVEDRNLKKDGFFQEKIGSQPQPGWLELRWIMRPDVLVVGDVLKAFHMYDFLFYIN